MATADQLIDLFNEARAKPAGAERARFLAQACDHDSHLKEQVLSLLQAEAAEGDSDFLKCAPLIGSTALLTEKPGDRIGRYKLLEKIGEGGCGVVYMAEQEQPVRRRVALKVIKLGMDTKQVIARFEAERQALALMDHPNIAKVLDAGATQTGRPFFVMELVRGIRITDYCDENSLSTNERIALFIQVCQAIQHAHQKGIIHRDIKPSNILVTEHDDLAVPKVIDFGIAKATTGQLTDKTLFTAFAQFIGTPAYMSPEQARMSGLDIDTRADIYSLGVLLYELLTGSTPFSARDLLAAGLDEMRRTIQEDEPARPSTCLSTMLASELTTIARRRQAEPPRLIHGIRGDLDWLVMKCLEKDRARRYETANALAMDLQRHLNDEPVVARPPSQSYRFQKLVRRNKLAVASTAAIAAALIIGLCVATFALLRERTARAEAETAQEIFRREAEKSSRVAGFLKEVLNGANPYASTARDRTLMREILDRASERIEKDLADEPEVQAELQNVMGGAYDMAGEPAIGERIHRRTLAMRSKLVGSEHLVATALEGLSTALRYQNRFKEAEGAIQESLAIRRKLWPGDNEAVATALRHLAITLMSLRRFPEADAALREALAMRTRLHGNENGSVADVLGLFCYLKMYETKWAEAEVWGRQALAMQRRNGESIALSMTLGKLGTIMQSLGKPVEALAFQRESLAMNEKFFGVQHPSAMLARYELMKLLSLQGAFAECETMLDQAIAEARSPGSRSSTLEGDRLGSLLIFSADLFRGQKQFDRALVSAKEALKVYEENPDWNLGRRHYAQDIVLELLDNRGDFAALEVLCRSIANDLASEASAKDPGLGYHLGRLTGTFLKLEKFSEAEAPARQCLQLREKTVPEEWTTFATRSMLGGSLLGQKRYAEAEPLLLSGYNGLKQRQAQIPADSIGFLEQAAERLVKFYEATGQSQKASDWREKQREIEKPEAAGKAAAPQP